MDNINISQSFSQIISFLVYAFRSVLDWLDSIIIIGDSTSLLDLNIAFTVFGIIFVAVFSVVHSSTSTIMDTVDSSSVRSERNGKSSGSHR